MSCESCGGELTVLGTLGNTTWARCRACGWEQTVEPVCPDCGGAPEHGGQNLIPTVRLDGTPGDPDICEHPCHDRYEDEDDWEEAA